MLARLKSSKTGRPLPSDWAEGVSRLMNDTYKSECEQNGRYFDVFGQIYPEELLLVISYLSEKDQFLAPITVFLSCGPDQIANVKKVTETQKNFIDLAGLFLDEIFANEGWDNFEPNWQEVTHKNETYFFKISRENLNATIEANRLLGDDFDLDLDEEQDH
jgi:hypothetical protein